MNSISFILVGVFSFHFFVMNNFSLSLQIHSMLWYKTGFNLNMTLSHLVRYLVTRVLPFHSIKFELCVCVCVCWFSVWLLFRIDFALLKNWKACSLLLLYRCGMEWMNEALDEHWFSIQCHLNGTSSRKIELKRNCCRYIHRWNWAII